MNEKQKYLAIARETLKAESTAILEAADALTDDFAKAVEEIINTKGKVVLTGTGKSGHIARKFSATLASTGTPSFYLHPAEAGHGDLGMLGNNDSVIALSYSGESDELGLVLDHCKRLNIPVILLTGQENSSLAKLANLKVTIKISTEACPLNLAPTSSTTAMLAVGDAIAIAVLTAKGFTPEDFANTHPQGALGRKLLIRVADLMLTGDKVPLIQATATIADAIVEINAKRLGFTLINNENKIAIFTDGDLRRCLSNEIDIHQSKIDKVMSKNPATISSDKLATEALNLMEEKHITCLPVIDDNKLLGVIDIHQIMQNKIA